MGYSVKVGRRGSITQLMVTDPQRPPSPVNAVDAPLLVLSASRRLTPPRALVEMAPLLLIGVAVAVLIPGTTATRLIGAGILAALAVARGYTATHDVGPAGRLAGPVMFAISIGTLQAITGEHLYDVILSLNVLLVALQEDRRTLVVTLAVTTLALAVPAILHPHSLAFRAVVWATLMPVMAFPIERRSRELRQRVQLGPKLRALQADMLAAGDSRSHLIDAAPELAGCDVVSLVEPQGGDMLVVTASSRPGLVGRAVPDDSRSLVRRAIRQRRPTFVPEATEGAGLMPTLLSDFSQITSWLCAPVTRGELVAAVLCVGWVDRVSREDDLRIDIVRSLATEASTTIDHTELLRTLSDDASSDELTGLMNRRGWDAMLSAEMANGRRRGTPLSVAILDLDHFKNYNDIHGHGAGDRLLREAAGAWTGALRRGDQLARWGGEEFTLLLPNCPGNAAVEVVERLRACTPGDQTCSAGIASWDGLESPASLFERMDGALYAAKTRGRDNAVLAPFPFEPELSPAWSGS